MAREIREAAEGNQLDGRLMMCSNCYYSILHKPINRNPYLCCHCNPPDYEGGFPYVDPNDWCGSWKPTS